MPPIAVSARPELVEGSRISVHTLGCKLNYAETSTIARSFVERGLALVPFDRETDVFVLNTCSVTENAEKECRQIVRRVLRQSPNAFVIATGCYAQLRPEELASIEGVDLVLGSKEKQDAIQYAGGFEKSKGPRIFVSEISDTKEFHFAETSEGHGHTRAFLKVQDGCDYSCSFCTIPMARGGSRSAKIEDITRRARALCADGFREIVLSGVNAGDFGRKSGTSFFELMLAMERDPEITARIRISSIEPNLLTDDIIDLVAASQKFCPHFHIPLQSGSDRILRLMKRRYAVGTYQAKIAWIKTSMPDACIGADVIAGFPGETDEDFRETCDFIRSLDLSYLHVFTFSERPGTKASTMPDAVPIHIRRDRTRLLRVISEKKRRAFHAGQIGREAEILVEQGMQGYSRNYVRARLTSDAPRGAIVRASLKEMNGDAVLAEPFEILKAPREEGLLPIL
ncbi:MAG TPA: tRNA (N(6)-L-threonylcarbamoyladenosine(37)-C(2))-methylthiotransferase MtaB [Candidatus Kapabacteria bacterium]|nr:tRNA (N(6)-L-threonylcarbamoyladenosine(37)-C(2))-methylthiotransferase MtaB [Candidatus Kapabacteria bacterium]